MRAIAEFAMRSRWHAIGTSMLAAVVPLMGWLTTVIVALVVLRYGVVAGSIVLLWATLPVGVALYYVGDPSPMIALTGAFMMAVLLRQALSWELVLVAAVFLSAVGTVIFEFGAAALLERFATFYLEYLVRIDSGIAMTREQAETLLLGFFALGQAVAMVVMLIIARWCQSALYNPGGFGREFRALSLSPGISGGVVAALLICYLFNDVLGRWLPLLTVPLVFAAISLMHWLVKTKELSTGWLAGFYAGLVLLFQLVYPLLASLALADSWFNLRNRIETIQKD